MRTGSYLATLLCLVTLNFAIPRVMPGDPVAALQVGSSSTFVADPALRDELGTAAATDVRERFAAARLLGRTQALYDELLRS